MAFEAIVKDFLRKSSWKDFLVEIEEVENTSNISATPQISKGKIRDGLIALLQIQDMRGLDVNLLTAFNDIDSKNLKEIRRTAREKSITFLREQIRKGNTFFIDAEALKETELTVLIPGILEARIKEIQRLEPKPPLSDVYSTYYGFSILTSGGIAKDMGGVPLETKDQLHRVMQQIGDVDTISARQLKFSYLSFNNCSDYLKTLLWNLLRMSIGGIKSQKAGIEILGNIDDSRGLDLMHGKLENVNNPKVKELLLENIGKIGHPHSFEVIMGQIDEGRNLNAVKALGLIRDPRVREILKGYSNRYYRRDQQDYFEALGNTRDGEWLPYLRKQTQRRRSRSKKAHIAIRKIESSQRY